MKSLIIKLLLTFLLIVSLLNCDDDKGNKYSYIEDDNEVNNNSIIEIFDAETPNGDELLAAENSLIRSALGVPVIDLAIY
ncbi:MAG: hypothetical protein GQ564_02150 [Bacteroidales bacterium]|nr:hypothetical protein [Bacteroidales bacterium]